MKNQTKIKWIKTSEKEYKSMNTNMIIFQILTAAEYGFSQWHVATNDDAEYQFTGKLNECKNYVDELIHSGKWDFEMHYSFGNKREEYICIGNHSFKLYYRLFWMMVKELQLHQKSTKPIQLIDIWKNENRVRVGHSLSQYNDAELGIMNSERPVATYHKVTTGKKGFQTIQCLVDGIEIEFDAWWNDVRNAIKNSNAEKINDTDEFLTYYIFGK